MAQIVPGTNFGQAFGTGLGQGLNALASLKLQQLQQRHGLGALGYTPEQAEQLSGLDPQILSQVVKQKLQEPSQLAYGQALQSLLGGAEQPELSAADLQNLVMSQPEIAAQAQQAPQMPGLSNLFPGVFKQPQIQAEAQQKATAQPSGLTPDQIKQLQQREVSGLKIPAKLTERQANELAKLSLKKQALEKGEIKERFKLSKEDRKQIIQDARIAKQDLSDLERLEELEKEGKLDTPGYTEFLKRSGLDIPALMEPGSEEFQKLAANFQRNAKQYYGGRVSNFEIEQFLKTIPSLSQSPEGRKRVIANLKNLSRAKVEYNNAFREVLADNNNIPPFDLLEQIDDKMEKKQEQLSKKFKEDLAKPVPKGQAKLVTALQATAGSIPGALKGAAKGAIAGAGIGSAFPGIGTAAGAIGGGLLGLLGGH